MLDVKLDDAAKELVDEAAAKLVPALRSMLQDTLDKLLAGLSGMRITVTITRGEPHDGPPSANQQV